MIYNTPSKIMYNNTTHVWLKKNEGLVWKWGECVVNNTITKITAWNNILTSNYRIILLKKG